MRFHRPVVRSRTHAPFVQSAIDFMGTGECSARSAITQARITRRYADLPLDENMGDEAFVRMVEVPDELA